MTPTFLSRQEKVFAVWSYQSFVLFGFYRRNIFEILCQFFEGVILRVGSLDIVDMEQFLKLFMDFQGGVLTVKTLI